MLVPERRAVAFVEGAEAAGFVVFLREAVTARLVVVFEEADTALGVLVFFDERRDARTRSATLSALGNLLLPFVRRSCTLSPMEVAVPGGLGWSGGIRPCWSGDTTPSC